MAERDEKLAPGDRDWTRLPSDVVAPGVRVTSGDLMAIPEITQPADVRTHPAKAAAFMI